MLLVIAALIGLGAGRDSAIHTPMSRSVLVPAPDSCLMADLAPSAHASSKPALAMRGNATRIVKRAAFTMVVPSNADVNDEQLLTFNLKECRYQCGISVHLFAGKVGTHLDSYIAAMMRRERLVDSVNNDPRSTARELHDYHGPPLAFHIPAGRGVALDGDCGDCAAASIFLERGPVIAELRLTADDREKGAPRILCQLATIARTFRWRN